MTRARQYTDYHSVPECEWGTGRGCQHWELSHDTSHTFKRLVDRLFNDYSRLHGLVSISALRDLLLQRAPTVAGPGLSDSAELAAPCHHIRDRAAMCMHVLSRRYRGREAVTESRQLSMVDTVISCSDCFAIFKCQISGTSIGSCDHPSRWSSLRIRCQGLVWPF